MSMLEIDDRDCIVGEVSVYPTGEIRGLRWLTAVVVIYFVEAGGMNSPCIGRGDVQFVDFPESVVGEYESC